MASTGHGIMRQLCLSLAITSITSKDIIYIPYKYKYRKLIVYECTFKNNEEREGDVMMSEYEFRFNLQKQ